MTHQPHTSLDLDEIAARAAGLYEYATGFDAAWQAEADRLTGTDVPALIEALRRLQQQRRYLLDQLAKKDAETGAGDRALREFLGSEQPDTLPAWLYQRFMPHGSGWDRLDTDDRAYWEHQGAAVRRAVARGGFKTAVESHVVADDSHDPEHTDDHPGCTTTP